MKFVIKKSKDKKPFVTIVAANGETLFTSETYESKAAARHVCELVKHDAPSAQVIDETKKSF